MHLLVNFFFSVVVALFILRFPQGIPIKFDVQTCRRQLNCALRSQKINLHKIHRRIYVIIVGLELQN